MVFHDVSENACDEALQIPSEIFRIATLSRRLGKKVHTHIREIKLQIRNITCSILTEIFFVMKRYCAILLSIISRKNHKCWREGESERDEQRTN